MQALSSPDFLFPLLLYLCYLLIALGTLKIAFYLLMTLTPKVWEKLIARENAVYVRCGLLSKKGSEAYKKLECSPWTKAFFGCGGLAVIFFAILAIALVHWMQTLPFWRY
jgi:hypothetical protein